MLNRKIYKLLWSPTFYRSLIIDLLVSPGLNGCSPSVTSGLYVTRATNERRGLVVGMTAGAVVFLASSVCRSSAWIKKNMIIWIQNITYDGELFQNAMNTVHEWSSNTMLYCDDATHRPKSWPPGPAPACLRPHIHTPRSPPLIYWALGGWEQWCGVYFRSRFPPWFSLMSALPVRGTSSRTEPEGRPSRNTSELSPYPSLEINVCLPLSLRAELELNKTKTEESVKKRFIKPGRIMFGVVEFVKQLQVIGLWIKRSDSDNNRRISILKESKIES